MATPNNPVSGPNDLKNVKNLETPTLNAEALKPGVLQYEEIGAHPGPMDLNFMYCGDGETTPENVLTRVLDIMATKDTDPQGYQAMLADNSDKGLEIKRNISYAIAANLLPEQLDPKVKQLKPNEAIPLNSLFSVQGPKVDISLKQWLQVFKQDPQNLVRLTQSLKQDALSNQGAGRNLGLTEASGALNDDDIKKAREAVNPSRLVIGGGLPGNGL